MNRPGGPSWRRGAGRVLASACLGLLAGTAGVVLAGTAGGLLAGAAGAVAAPIVPTESGAVRGVADAEGTVSWRGIPYAAPPVGSRRWRPPAAPLPWTSIREGASFGPACPQSTRRPDRRAMPEREDCLTLSVTAPARHRRALPVLVWIHGGAFLGGASSLPLYDGASLSRLGVVFVALNYRLGALGWLANPALSAASPDHVSGNYGLLDQIAALRWVRRNIAAFGGDPSRVTVFGESAGATAIRALLIAPAARGLFRGAIMESPAAGYRMATLAEAERAGSVLGTDGRALRALGVDDLVRAGMRFAPRSDTLVPMAYPAPVVDGRVLPLSWDDAVRAHAVAPVPVLVGSNADEGLLFARALPVTSASGFSADLDRMFGRLAPDAHRVFPAGTLDDARASAVRLIGEQRYTIGAAEIGRDMTALGHPAWRYVFSRRLGDGLLPPTHAAELPYVFGTFAALVYGAVAPNGRDLALSDRMEAAWVRFARTGNPNGPGLPGWPRAGSGEEMVFDAVPSVASPPDEAALALIAARYGEPAEAAPSAR